MHFTRTSFSKMETASGSAMAETLTSRLRAVSNLADGAAFLQGLLGWLLETLQAHQVAIHTWEGGSPEEKSVVLSPDAPAGISLKIAEILSSLDLNRKWIRMLAPSTGELCVQVFVGSDNRPWLLSVALPVTEPSRAEGPLVLWMQMAIDQVSLRATTQEAARLRAAFHQATALTEVFAQSAVAPDRARAFGAMASEFQNLLGGARVALGWGDARTCRPEAISGMQRFDVRGEATSQLRTLMREATTTETPVVWPLDAHAPEVALPAGDAQPLLESFKAGQVIAYPLKLDEGRIVGAMVALWPRPGMVSTRLWEIMDITAPLLAAQIRLLDEAKPRGFRGTVRSHWAQASSHRKLALAIGSALMLAALLVPVPHRVTAEFKLQAQAIRQVAAPFESRLEAPLPKRGCGGGGRSSGHSGRQRNGLAPCRGRGQKSGSFEKRDQAMATRDVAAAQQVQLEAEGLALEVALLADRQKNLEIRAPIRGVILAGNLRSSEESPWPWDKNCSTLPPSRCFAPKLRFRTPTFPGSRVGRKCASGWSQIPPQPTNPPLEKFIPCPRSCRTRMSSFARHWCPMFREISAPECEGGPASRAPADLWAGFCSTESGNSSDFTCGEALPHNCRGPRGAGLVPRPPAAPPGGAVHLSAPAQ
ncbi:MAG: hypothetical protein R3F31_18020 [Verrucomicrobiales bacterium]